MCFVFYVRLFMFMLDMIHIILDVIHAYRRCDSCLFWTCFMLS
jgi:hypothetical protein